jgi:hypothetical protein
MNGRNIPFVNSVRYLGVIFVMTEANAFRIFITAYTLLKIERLCANIKLTLHRLLIRSVLTYACPAWEFAADTHLLKL